jgi:NADH:ubiquinone oxidoreductase subunit E
MGGPLETLWQEILSRQPQRIREAFEGLEEKQKDAILKHLDRMASEDGWHTEQAASAQAALKSLEGDRQE